MSSSAEHVPAFVHATVHLRQLDPDPADASRVWLALFSQRLVQIFDFRSEQYNNNNNTAGNNSNGATQQQQQQHLQQPHQQLQQQHQLMTTPPTAPPPPPKAILTRFLLCCGCLVPGTLPRTVPSYSQPATQSSQATMQSVTDDSPIRDDDGVAELAYDEWLAWVFSSTTTSNSTSDNFNNNSNNNNANRGLFSTSKFAFSTSIKIGSLFQFVSVAALQSCSRCRLIGTAVVARAQAAILAAVSKMAVAPVPPPLPPPFLLAHLPGLCGATGEAFADVHRDEEQQQQQNQQSSVDFFSFIVQRCVQLPGASGELGLQLRFLDQIVEDSHAPVRRENRDGRSSRENSAAELRIRQRSDTGGGGGGAASSRESNNNNNNNNYNSNQNENENEEEAEDRLLTAPGAASLTASDALATLWTPRWAYGCARFTALPSRLLTASSSAAAGLAVATSAAARRELPMAGLVKLALYQEPFACRYILLVAQRLLAASSAQQEQQEQNTFRLCGRLAFWAATVAASFPMELDRNHSTSTLSSSLTRRINSAAAAAAIGGAAAAASSSSSSASGAGAPPTDVASLCGLHNVNELLSVPCMSACLSLYCSLQLIKDQNQNQNNNAEQRANSACEALLSVSLAYAACSFVCGSSSSSSTAMLSPAAQGAFTLRQVVLAVASQWITISYPLGSFRVDVPHHIVACMPLELQAVIQEKLSGKYDNFVGILSDQESFEQGQGNNQQQQVPLESPPRRVFSISRRGAVVTKPELNLQQNQQQQQQQQTDAAASTRTTKPGGKRAGRGGGRLAQQQHRQSNNNTTNNDDDDDDDDSFQSPQRSQQQQQQQSGDAAVEAQLLNLWAQLEAAAFSDC